MRAGRLRNRAEVYSYVVSARDTAGQPTSPYVLQWSKWCGIEALPGSERHTDDRDQAFGQQRIVMRYDSETVTIEPKWRIVFGTRIFDITSVMNVDQENRQITFRAIERY